MTLMVLGKRLGTRALAVLAVCGVCVATGATPGEAATTPLPVAMTMGTPNPNTADPGVLLDNNNFYAFSTGTKDRPGLQESTSMTAGGPWTQPTDVLADKAGMPGVPQTLPSWMASGPALWAPDMVKTTSGAYVVYFSAALANIPAGSPSGNDSMPASGARCIGTAEAGSATGPFVYDQNPLVCLPGYGAADDMPIDPADPVHRLAGEGAIDASPRFVTIDGAQELFLVYKTQQLPATIRMVRLADDDGTTVVGDSHQLVYSTSETIEAPSLVQNGSHFILFVAHGDFSTCDYSTQWYQSQHIWSWTNTGATTLLDMSNTGGLCGPGSADVTASEVSGQDRIFFHGWVKDGIQNVPATAQNLTDHVGIRVMYAAVLTFASDGFTPLIGAYQGQS